MTYLTFAAEFNAVHRLWNDALSREDNIDVFGECANPAGHGHKYRIEVTLARAIDAANPVVYGRRRIEALVNDVLAPRLKHGDLNTSFGIDGFVSTGENVTRALWELIEPEVPADLKLVALKVVETPKNSFVYFGKGTDAPRVSLC